MDRLFGKLLTAATATRLPRPARQFPAGGFIYRKMPQRKLLEKVVDRLLGEV